MAHLTESELETIVQRDLPQRRIVGRAELNGVATGAEASAPELDEMQRKFGVDGSTFSRVAARAETDAVYGTGEDFDDEIVIVELAIDKSNPWKSGSQRKAVVVSGSQRRVIGEQG